MFVSLFKNDIDEQAQEEDFIEIIEPPKTQRVLEYRPAHKQRDSLSSQPLEPDFVDGKSVFTNIRDKKELIDHLTKNNKKQKLKEYEEIKQKKELDGCTFKPQTYSK